MPGTITLRPIEANLTHNTDLLTKMNPYCTFVLGSQRFNSQICKKGGKHPVWNDQISIPIGNETKLMVEVMDKDKITKDDVIGSFLLDLQEVASQQHVNRWYPLFYKNKPAGEILMEADFIGDNLGLGLGQTGLNQTNLSQTGLNQAGFSQEQGMMGTALGSTESFTGETIAMSKPEFAHQETTLRTGFVEEPTHVFTEQRQVVEPHTFMKEVEVVETRPVIKEIEVTEPVKVLKEVQYTEVVPVKKQIETIEPHVVSKEVEVIEPRLVTKEIQVIENVPVMKQVEIIENTPVIKEVETYEPQTFTKQVEVTEQVPVRKQVTVTEPVTLRKPVEFVEPVITTQTITKEVQPAVIVDEKITTEVGPASLIGIGQEIRTDIRQGVAVHETTQINRTLENTGLTQQQQFYEGNLNRTGEFGLDRNTGLNQGNLNRSGDLGLDRNNRLNQGNLDPNFRNNEML